MRLHVVPARIRRLDRADPVRRRAEQALPRLRALDHHGPLAAGRARRAEAGPATRPLRHAQAAPRPGQRLQEVRPRGWRCDRQVSPPRRGRDLRRHGAPRAGVRPALPAGRRPGQLRQHRRRQCRRHALHRGAPDRGSAGAARRHRSGHGRLPPDLRRRRRGAGGPAGRLSQSARQRYQRHRGRHGDQRAAP